MDLTYHSPIRFDFKPISESTITFEFKLKSSKFNIKINIDTNIYYKEQYVIGRTSLLNSGAQSVYTSGEDKVHTLKFKIPRFDSYIQSYIYITMEQLAGHPYEKVNVEDIKIVEMIDMTYSHPNAAYAVPSIAPKISPQQINTILPNVVPNIVPNNYGTIREWYNKIMLVSSWDIKCGIAQYTKDLLESLEKIKPGNFMVRNVESSNHVGARLVHLQNELSIMPIPPIVGGKVIITWHSITRNMSGIIRQFESQLDVVAHIIPCEGAREFMTTSKDVYVVGLGSKIMSQMNKEDARRILGLTHITRPIGFIFGFQSPNKNFNRLINAARNYGIHLIISGSTHFSGYRSNISTGENITFLNRYLSEEEIDLYALASDLLLFDYDLQDHYSCSSAMHRTVGAGRPMTCTNSKHFTDIDKIPKFLDQKGLEESINFALTNIDWLSKYALDYAKETNWENVAKRHLDIYRKYIDI